MAETLNEIKKQDRQILEGIEIQTSIRAMSDS